MWIVSVKYTQYVYERWTEIKIKEMPACIIIYNPGF